MSRDYKIGQILYIISRTSRSVVPVQVVEINRKTTTSGESITFLVQDPKKKGPINLDEVAGDVYTDSHEVTRYLKDSANKAIDEMMHSVLEVSSIAFASPKPEEVGLEYSVPVKRADIHMPPSEGEIELASINGQPQKARIRSIKMPESLQ